MPVPFAGAITLTDPVAVVQVGCVVDAVGADGVVGCALIVMVVAVEVQLLALVVVSE